MPAFLPDAPAEPDDYDEAMTLAPSSDALAMGQIFRDAQLSSKRPLAAMFAADAEKFDRDMERMTGVSDKLDPAEVKSRFGVDVGHPVTEATAGYLARQARERAFRDDVLSRADLNPLQMLGASLAGGLLDPAGLPLLFAPEVLGVRSAIEGTLAARSAARAGEAIVKTGRLANIGRGALAAGGEGLAGGALFEAPNYGLRRYSGEDDYTLGDSLANVLGAGLFGAGLGGLGGAFHEVRAPRVLGAMPEESRLGAAALALDAAAEDRPVRVGGLAEAEQARARPTAEALSALDETPGDGVLAARRLDEATAVTTRGTEIPVRYALVELKDLVTSHDDDLARNPAFPPALQPRSRERAGAQARNHALEAELNPKRLMRETGAESGAPIVSRDGVVESGNGRTIALRRSAARGGEAYGRYRAELEAQGFDTTGMREPVLVRLRTQALSGERRAALTREMNADVTERMGAAEQAMADAAALPDAALAAPDGEEAGRLVTKDFARRFIAATAPDQANQFVTPDGVLSAAGEQRIKAALVAKAYGDARLVEAVFEGADSAIRSLGQAMADAAPDWARMRAAAARGDIPPAMDLTGSLRSAVDLVRHAREQKTPLAQVLAERAGQTEMFAGEAISPETEAFLRLLYADEALKRQRRPEEIAAALRDYARRAQQAAPGPDLFGATADDETARFILADLAQRYGRADAAGAAEPAGLGLRDAGPVLERPDLRPQGGGSAGGEGGSAEPVARLTGDEIAPAGKNDKDAVKTVRAWAETHLLGKQVDSEALGRPVGFNGTGVKKATSFAGDARKLALFPALPQVIEKGRLAETRAPRAGDTGVRALHVLEAKVELAGEPLTVRVQVRETVNGAFHYDHFVVKKAPAGSGDHIAPATKLGDRPAGGESPADKIIQSDPELKALADDTEALIAATGVEVPDGVGAADPNIVAEAIRAAAWCLSGGGE